MLSGSEPDLQDFSLLLRLKCRDEKAASRRTAAVLKGAPPSPLLRGDQPLVHRHIQAGVDRELDPLLLDRGDVGAVALHEVVHAEAKLHIPHPVVVPADRAAEGVFGAALHRAVARLVDVAGEHRRVVARGRRERDALPRLQGEERLGREEGRLAALHAVAADRRRLPGPLKGGEVRHGGEVRDERGDLDLLHEHLRRRAVGRVAVALDLDPVIGLRGAVGDREHADGLVDRGVLRLARQVHAVAVLVDAVIADLGRSRVDRRVGAVAVGDVVPVAVAVGVRVAGARDRVAADERVAAAGVDLRVAVVLLLLGEVLIDAAGHEADDERENGTPPSCYWALNNAKTWRHRGTKKTQKYSTF